MKNYKVSIEFYLKAKDDNDALGTADTLAGMVEDEFQTPHGDEVNAKVNTPHEIASDK